ncbi:MAG: hypothetical protein JJT94_12025 [Bernardetiaceae bacterium]|nr:hypothetical protein [Bernardetiaceae bacterium]
MHIFRRLLKWFVILIIIVLVFGVAFLRPLQEAPDSKQFVLSDYIREQAPRDSLPLKVGWAEATILGESQVSLAGYGPRDTWHEVLDTPKVKVFALERGELKALIFSIDLLIFPPELAERLKRQYQEEYLLYFTATHTHNGMGGWLKGAAAYFLAGSYDISLMQHLELQTKKAVVASISQTKNAHISYLKIAAPAHCRHRLDAEAYRDVYIRMLIFEQEEVGQRAALITYAAHNTTLKSRSPILSGDYAAVLTQKLLTKKYFDFVAFAAGAVGSHGPKTYEAVTHLEARKQMGEALADTIITNLPKVERIAHATLAYSQQPLQIACAPRLLGRWQLRPQVFNLLLQEPKPYIQALQIGKILLMGMPCDFSGELIPDIEQYLETPRELIITSFNGAYIGYVAHDRHYDLKKPEVREMNWGGRGLGNYFTDIAVQMIENF